MRLSSHAAIALALAITAFGGPISAAPISDVRDQTIAQANPAPATAAPVNATLTGTVYDGATNKPLGGANLTISNASHSYSVTDGGRRHVPHLASRGRLRYRRDRGWLPSLADAVVRPERRRDVDRSRSTSRKQTRVRFARSAASSVRVAPRSTRRRAQRPRSITPRLRRRIFRISRHSSKNFRA